ncbi:hypothetical protein AB0B15_43345 [Streptomyces sp. NPDC045456]|uniref:RipA family octameric membrane protein n=1 Tax=Streptomyces sp. NPDC045456 TaxID=3155254 RepID=UPI0033FE4FA6
MGDDPDNETASDRRAADDRLWQHGLHEETMLFQRGDLFLLAQSLQVVGYSTVLAASAGTGEGARDNLIAARAIAAFGIVLTLTWVYSAHRHYKYKQGVQHHVIRRLPYVAAHTAGRSRGPSHLPLIVYVLPALSGIMWITLLLLI